MKHLRNSLIITSLLLLFTLGTAHKVTAQNVMVSYQTFYDELSPYGQWVYDPDYGNVWIPNEGNDFRPYGTRGYWAMTEYGNMWISEDPYAWAVYHYGRWTFNSYYGWVWIPGYEWAPAWVSWRYGGGYCGWAPLAPGINIGMNYNYPDNWWVFVSPRYMYQRNCFSYWRGARYNRTYIRQTTVINNIYVDNSTRVQYNYGPRATTIQQVTRQPVQVYRVSQVTRPGNSVVSQNNINIYRPMVNQTTASTTRPANIMQAPRNIGRPQSADVSSTPPPFRQEITRNNSGRSGGVERGDRIAPSDPVMNDRNGTSRNNVGNVERGTTPRNDQSAPTDRNNVQRYDRGNINRYDQAPPTDRNNIQRYDQGTDNRYNQAPPVDRNNIQRYDQGTDNRYNQAPPVNRNNVQRYDQGTDNRYNQAPPVNRNNVQRYDQGYNNPAPPDRPSRNVIRYDRGETQPSNDRAENNYNQRNDRVETQTNPAPRNDRGNWQRAEVPNNENRYQSERRTENNYTPPARNNAPQNYEAPRPTPQPRETYRPEPQRQQYQAPPAAAPAPAPRQEAPRQEAAPQRPTQQENSRPSGRFGR